RVRRCNEQMLHEIVVLRRSSEAAFAAAALPRIGRNGRSFYVSGLRDRDRNVLIRNEVFDAQFDTGVDDLSAAFVAETLANIGEFVSDHLPQNAFVIENVLE